MPADYLPPVYQALRTRYPAVLEAWDRVAAATHSAGPLTPREAHLVQLGIAIGARSPGGVRSHARRALAEGIEADALLQAALLALTTSGITATTAAFGWIQEVLKEAEAGT
ncbi:Carboxymuconolactone decarboxylase family protein [Candidatus Hydrogenisulfobacillus filiaventi]|uniref:Carboxymuconolactone decarboxylase family protein n=1 Tax=Candidatus Hydrogenisulfobacillus filiaventi TaxID=2707344 RepID=A0A6F8ZCY9_9FIRM|nr:carboxymuconolactone decarboxylase family protein [Bacillota bacterium]CAB1127518.1 Carboxymuconolactone decarboxylase family protein [Candidatus Hydrogenisulfobacillus filiaventi]